MPKPLQIKLEKVEFTFSGLFTFDCFKSERELSPVPMMAYYYAMQSGAVSVASLWTKRWIGELAQWQPVHLPRFQVVLIEAQIEDGLRKEREEDSRNVREVAGGFV